MAHKEVRLPETKSTEFRCSFVENFDRVEAFCFSEESDVPRLTSENVSEDDGFFPRTYVSTDDPNGSVFLRVKHMSAVLILNPMCL